MQMKKVFILILIAISLITGCGKKDNERIKTSFINKINDTKSYLLKANMEVYNEEETFTYTIEASYLKDNFYKVKMINQTNNHEQILLRNKDAVYVVTPSLNKSFKFQSKWPDNSSQSYLLKQIVKDITNDTNSEIKELDGNIIIKSAVNYPNNPELKYQNTTIDKDGNIKSNEVYDEQNNIKIKVLFMNVDYKVSLKEQDFKIEDYIKENECQDCEEEKKTSVIDNIIYPLFIPSNTYLTSSDKVATENGDRVILTFSGDKNFVLIEEASNIADEFEIIPVYGDPLIISDTVGAMGANSLMWTKNDISYYLTGNDLTTKELLSIGESIGYTNKTVSMEK